MRSLNAQLLPLFLLWLLATFAPGEANARSLVEQWLGKPNVRVLVVVFTTADCPACRKAERHWAKLHQRYLHQGLHIVEVSDGTAKKRGTGWSPDALLQDPTLELHHTFDVEDYPQAFVWSWGGVQLAAHAGPTLVEATVRAYFYALPRILVENPVDRTGRTPQGAGALRIMVEQELARQSKFVVVASESDRAHLRKLRKRSLQSHTQDEMRCRLGREIPPNSVLEIEVHSTPEGRLLLLRLLSIEQACTRTMASNLVSGRHLALAVETAVRSLVLGAVGHTLEPVASTEQPEPADNSVASLASVHEAPPPQPSPPVPIRTVPCSRTVGFEQNRLANFHLFSWIPVVGQVTALYPSRIRGDSWGTSSTARLPAREILSRRQRWVWQTEVWALLAVFGTGVALTVSGVDTGDQLATAAGITAMTVGYAGIPAVDYYWERKVVPARLHALCSSGKITRSTGKLRKPTGLLPVRMSSAGFGLKATW